MFLSHLILGIQARDLFYMKLQSATTTKYIYDGPRGAKITFVSSTSDAKKFWLSQHISNEMMVKIRCGNGGEDVITLNDNGDLVFSRESSSQDGNQYFRIVKTKWYKGGYAWVYAFQINGMYLSYQSMNLTLAYENSSFENERFEFKETHGNTNIAPIQISGYGEFVEGGQEHSSYNLLNSKGNAASLFNGSAVFDKGGQSYSSYNASDAKHNPASLFNGSNEFDKGGQSYSSYNASDAKHNPTSLFNGSNEFDKGSQDYSSYNSSDAKHNATRVTHGIDYNDGYNSNFEGNGNMGGDGDEDVYLKGFGNAHHHKYSSGRSSFQDLHKHWNHSSRDFRHNNRLASYNHGLRNSYVQKHTRHRLANDYLDEPYLDGLYADKSHADSLYAENMYADTSYSDILHNNRSRTLRLNAANMYEDTSYLDTSLGDELRVENLYGGNVSTKTAIENRLLTENISNRNLGYLYDVAFVANANKRYEDYKNNYNRESYGAAILNSNATCYITTES